MMYRGDTKCQHVVEGVIHLRVTPWLEFKPQLGTKLEIGHMYLLFIKAIDKVEQIDRIDIYTYIYFVYYIN